METCRERERERDDPPLIARYLELENHLTSLLDHEEQFWKQKAKAYWLHDGDSKH